MDRRELLMAAGGVVALAATSGVASAAEHKHPAGHVHPAGGAGKALAQSALDCVMTAEAGIRHCLMELGKGEKALAECAAKMNELKIVCAALAGLSSFDSAHAKEMARLTIKVCEASEKECRKFEKHKECVECADSCKKCVEECKKAGA